MREYAVRVRLDAEKLETLRRWGEGLSGDDRDELRSAGRAILLLIEEIERLHIDLWHARPPEEHAPESAPELTEELATPLRARLARRFR